MTGRERLTAVYHGQLADRVPWAPLVFQDTLSAYPEQVRTKGPTAFTCDIGGDVLYRGTFHCVESEPIETVEHVNGQTKMIEYRTPYGMLREVRYGGRIMEHRVKSPADYDALKYLCESQRFRFDEEKYRAAEREVGDSGIVTVSVLPTPVQRLVEFDMGVEGFTYQLTDHPREVEELMAAMHAKDLELYQILAASPAEFVMIYENTSTTMISPAIYERYSVEHVRGFVDAIHARDKVAIVHMCGTVRRLLHLIRQTGLDAVDCLTPPPTGDTDFREAIGVWGPTVTIHGLLDPSKWTHRPIGEIERHIHELLVPEVLAHAFVLCTAADGLPGIPIQKFTAIGRIMERYK